MHNITKLYWVFSFELTAKIKLLKNLIWEVALTTGGGYRGNKAFYFDLSKIEETDIFDFGIVSQMYSKVRAARQ